MSDVNSVLAMLRHWSLEGVIRSVDYQFARFLDEQHQLPEKIQLLSALVSHELAAGNVCLPLSKLKDPHGHWSDEITGVVLTMDWRSLASDGELLGDGSHVTPLVLDKDRVYLYRYWQYECQTAAALNSRNGRVNIDRSLLTDGLANFFPESDSLEIDWQKIAAAVAVQKRFAVISGGPGTGKTTTVIKLLALYIEQQRALGRSHSIQLAAPTGKAAARLAESISNAMARLDIGEELKTEIPTQASTLHRLLGVIPNSIRFRHDEENPLHLDLLVLDEASMVDLPMMARLLRALPDSARLILLGDKDQLASVEAGSVLGDICNWSGRLSYSMPQRQVLAELCCLSGRSRDDFLHQGSHEAAAEPYAQASLFDASSPDLPIQMQATEDTFADCLAMLHKSYRFHDQSGIGFLARAVNSGQRDAVKSVLGSNYPDINILNLSQDSYEALIKSVVDVYVNLFQRLFANELPQQLLECLMHFQLLCARREGEYGVSGLNERVYQGLKGRGLIQGDSAWYAGRPIMITRNDPALSLFNGDIGIAAEDSEGRLKVWFMLDGEMRSVLPSRLPEHETVFAMTIHKSQGSEFDRVCIILPPADSPLLSKELLYTGITRAKKQLDIVASEHVLYQATERRTNRAGGLALRLWGRN